MSDSTIISIIKTIGSFLVVIALDLEFDISTASFILMMIGLQLISSEWE